jgi:succinate dehydrogenase / fumarate reductase cytochrome b subunit
MTLIQNLWRSTIGKKVVMAVTGLIGLGFVISHVASNLSVFSGGEHLDDYAKFLRTLGPLLWVARAVLVAAVILHVVAAVQLFGRNRGARPVGYRTREPQVSTLASRSMRWGGAILLAFIVFHLADLTWGWVNPGFVHLAPSRNMAASLTRWPVALFYLLAMVSLGLHIWHGAWSSMRTLGAARPSAAPLRRVLPILLAVAIAGGFAAIPLAYLLGVLPRP